MSQNTNSFRDEILREAMHELSALRRKALAIPDQSQVDGAIEAIEFYEAELPTLTHPIQLIEWCGRAMADVHHELAAAEYGFESPQAEAVYEEQERELKKLFLALRQA